MKTFLKMMCLLVLAVYFVLAITVFNHPKEGVVCAGVNLVVEDSMQTGFINESDVRGILTRAKVYPEGKMLEEVNLRQLEEVLTKNPYIEKALCYQTADNRIHVEVTPLHPALYIMSATGEKPYYMDGYGRAMPAQGYTADVAVVTGAVTQKYARKNLASLGRFIQQDDFWDKQIQQIHVLENGEVELIPRVGNHTILLGAPQGFRDKLKRMELFYAQGFPKVGWNKYSTINLKYADQVICTRRK